MSPEKEVNDRLENNNMNQSAALEVGHKAIPLDQKIAFGIGMLANQMFPASLGIFMVCLLYTSPSPRDRTRSRMPSSA